MTSEYVTHNIAEYVSTLFPGDFIGVCVDIGAYDPFWTSNSWIFEEKGWSVYCIEPNPSCIPKLKKYRKNVLEYACSDKNDDNVNLYIYSCPGAGFNILNKDEWEGEAAATGLLLHHNYDVVKEIIKVKVRTLDWLMENEIHQDHIDYLSIDVELNELTVLSGISLDKWKPKVIVIENIFDDLEQRDYLLSRGYRYVHRMTCNDFYMLNEHYLEHTKGKT